MLPSGYSDLTRSSQLKSLKVNSTRNLNPSKRKAGMAASARIALSRKISANKASAFIGVEASQDRELRGWLTVLPYRRNDGESLKLV